MIVPLRLDRLSGKQQSSTLQNMRQPRPRGLACQYGSQHQSGIKLGIDDACVKGDAGYDNARAASRIQSRGQIH